ncbi:MAG TPA: LPS export ABC transporter periplasmic protein LptC [Xanthobacteraceae bacterium]|jgi:lipopolysaccharide export system protein LptC|nr:LPS export ABC transporter periplasmic protein LptC [Xanthobacteraceae bacterium]
MSRSSPLAKTVAQPTGHEGDDLLRRRERAFRDATRHSRRVHLLRRVLPVLAGIAAILTFLWLWFDPLRYVRELPVQVGALKISGSKLTMEAPKLTGFSKDGQPYSITATSAAQDLTKTSIIELAGIIGKFTSEERGETVLEAKSGMYDAKDEKMRLFGDVHIRSEQGGYTGVLRDVVGEPKKGQMVSEHPVHVTFTDGNLRSDRVEVFDHGKVAIFEGNVVLNLKDSAISLKDDETAEVRRAKPARK